MKTTEIIKKNIQESISIKSDLLGDTNLINNIEIASKKCIEAINNNHKILIAGNGGSASDSQHFAAEIVGRYEVNRDAKAAIALTTDTSILTAIANDFGYEYVFSRQIEGLGKPNDIFIAISTSGNSKNIIESLKSANKLGLTTIGLTGKTAGNMKDLVDILLNVPSEKTSRIQESHIMILQIICLLLEIDFIKV
jgi:D-sedoheptulose 7-phosphate isomerase|tara:strand:- start:7203 stop:7787 length:585 start_codon:yes stop_codon:yes gene_type:complete